MTITNATFDLLFHKFDFNFPDNEAALDYVQGFFGNNVVQNQALHETTHFYFSHSPVSRAIRALRNKSLYELIRAIALMAARRPAEVSEERFHRAINQWRMGEAINQYLLPVYEGAALMAEFDACLVPEIRDSDLMTVMNIQAEQAKAALNRGVVSTAGAHHRDYGIPDPQWGSLLDATAERLLSPEIVARKTAMLNYPVYYERPADCYLVAWLFVREVHQLLSIADDSTVNPIFVMKYMRSFFLEDWGLVARILDLFYARTDNTANVVAHLQARLALLSNNVTGRDVDKYRRGIEDLHRRGEANYEFLPGLHLDRNEQQCHVLFNALQAASYRDFAAEVASDLEQAIFVYLVALQNRMNYPQIHKGRYTVCCDGQRVVLSAGGTRLYLNWSADEEHFEPTEAEVSFYLTAAGEKLERIARIDLGDRTATAWIGEGDSNAVVVLSGIFKFFEQSERVDRFVNEHLSMIYRMFGMDIETARHEGCLTGRNLILRWLSDQGHFFCQLGALWQAQNYETPPRATFSRLFNGVFSAEEFKLLIRHSLAYGVGYNIGAISRGPARKKFLNRGNFQAEIEGTYRIEKETGLPDFQFFYIEETDDGHELPRYYF